MADFEVVEMTAQNLQLEKQDMEAELEEAHSLLQQQVDKIQEYESLIESMGAQLKENEEFRAALAEREMKLKIAENFGVAEPSANERTQSQASFSDGGSQLIKKKFTATI